MHVWASASMSSGHLEIGPFTTTTKHVFLLLCLHAWHTGLLPSARQVTTDVNGTAMYRFALCAAKYRRRSKHPNTGAVRQHSEHIVIVAAE